ncbi:1550_t:CDS:2, partial [Racocetra fulgida]
KRGEAWETKQFPKLRRPVLLLKVMSKKLKLKPLTNTERSQLLRAQQTHHGNLLKKWEEARQIIGKITSHLGKPRARKYYPNRPATSTERNRKRRRKEKFQRELAKISQQEFYYCNKCDHARKHDNANTTQKPNATKHYF